MESAVLCLDTVPVHGSLLPHALSSRMYEVKLLATGPMSYALLLSPVATADFIRVELAATTAVTPTFAELDTGVDFRQRYHMTLRTKHGASLVLNLVTKQRFHKWHAEVCDCVAVNPLSLRDRGY